jgi:hypothetical protein
MHNAWAAGLSMLALIGTAHANDGAFHGNGATVFAYKDNRVQMVSEHIRIRHAPDDAHPRREWAAECSFTFKNLTDEPVSLQMGFPDSRAYPSQDWSIQAFEAQIKGKTIPVMHKAVSAERPGFLMPQIRGETKAEPPKPDAQTVAWREMAKALMTRMDLGFSGAYTWPVSFAAGEELTVKNRYRFGGMGSMGPIDMCLRDRKPSGAFWHGSPQATGFGSGPCSEATYVVTSGKTWVAPIGEAIIEIDIPPGQAPNHIIPFPAATQVTPQKVRWHFKDFRPTEEISVVFAYSLSNSEDGYGGHIDFSTAEQVKRWLIFAKANGFTHESLARMHAIQAYSFGIRTDNDHIRDVFNEYLPPLSDQERKPSELTPEQRQILVLLSRAAAEKK